MHRGRSGRGNRVNLAGNPAIKFIWLRKAANVYRSFLTRFHGKRLPFFEARGLVLMQNTDLPSDLFDRAGIVKIIQTEGRAAACFNSEISAGHAEIIALQRVHMKRSAALPQNQAGNQSAVFQRKVVKLKNRVFLQESQRAVLKFHFGAPVVGRENVALSHGQVQRGPVPVRLRVGQRISMRFCSEAHVAGDHAEPDDAGMARARGSARPAQEQRYEKTWKQHRKQFAGSHNSPPSGDAA